MMISERTGRRSHAPGWRLAAVTFFASLALASCGAQSGRAIGSGVTPTPTTPWKWTKGALTPPPLQTPLPTPTPPYAFPYAWQRPAGGPGGVGTFSFAPSVPAIGYVCAAEPAAMVGLKPAAGTSPADTAALYATRDGGQTWTPLAAPPFGQCQDDALLVVDQSDAGDLFVAEGMMLASTQPEPYVLWRSRDGGASWSDLAAPGVTAEYPAQLNNLAVVGTRLVAEVGYAGEGAPANSLFSSDDGGQTWQPLGMNIANQHVNADTFATLGTTLLVESCTPPLPQAVAGSVALMAGGWPTGHSVMSAPGPSCSSPLAYWWTRDGGRTFTPADVPGTFPHFTRATSGNIYYGVVTDSQAGDGPATVYWTRDSGTTWIPLPTLLGVENGYLDAKTIGEIDVAADGTVFVSAWHDLQAQGGVAPAGIFMLHPSDQAPTWRPVASAVAQRWQIVITTTGTRLWGIQSASPLALLYVDLRPTADDRGRAKLSGAPQPAGAS